MTAPTNGTAAEPAPSALRASATGRWRLFIATAVIVTIADQVTKAWVDGEDASGAPRFPLASTGQPVPGLAAPTPLLGEFVRIAKSYNDGGIFGLFGDSALVLGVASLAVIGVILLYQLRQSSTSGPLSSLTLGLLLGGAVGNLIDRLRHGYVIDFVDMGIGALRWYTFNVADAAISTAIVVLLAMSILGDRLPGGRAGAVARPMPAAEGRAPEQGRVP